MSERCILCPKKFQSQKDLNKHYKKIHGGIPLVIRPMILEDLFKEKQ